MLNLSLVLSPLLLIGLEISEISQGLFSNILALVSVTLTSAAIFLVLVST